MAMFGADGELQAAAAAFVDDLPAAAARATAAAPAEISDDLATVLAALGGLQEDLAATELGDADAIAGAIFDAVDADDGDDIDFAFQRLEADVAEVCDGDSGASAADVDALPDPCGLTDPSTVVAASGLNDSFDAGRTANSFVFPGLSSIQCVYDGDAVTLTIEVIGYSNLDTARGMYSDNAHVVLDGVDLGGLPSSTLLTETEGSPALQAIYVFEAPTPFGIHLFPSSVDSADLVAAAETVLAPG